ncbi:hypothetical protein PJI20_10230 [Mycobacterium kansasii]
MDSMRYNHAMIADHVSAQANLVAHMTDLRTQALNVLASVAEIWHEHGSNAYQQAHHQIDLAFQKVFDTIGRHGQAQSTADTNSLVTDQGVAAGFGGL